MADRIRLTATTPSTPELLQMLMRAELPAETWKRLCFAFLRRFHQTTPVLAQLCAVEACDLAFSLAFATPYRHEPEVGDMLGRGLRGEVSEAFREEKLQAIESRKIGRGRVRRHGLPDVQVLAAHYRSVRDLIQTTDPPALRAGLQKLWTRLRGPGPIPETVVIAAKDRRRRGRAAAARAAALLFVAEIHEASSPETVAAILRQHGVRLTEERWRRVKT